MRVGILTFHSSYNFGANLQTLATQSALEKRGVEPVVVNYRDPAKRALYHELTPPAQAEEHERFLREYLRLSPLLATAREVQDFCLDGGLDAIVVGSDAVFRLVPRRSLLRAVRQLAGRAQPSLAGELSDALPPYWLDWRRPAGVVRPLKAALSGSSAGTRFYQLPLRAYGPLRRCTRDFDFLSARDGWTRLMLAVLSGGTRVPDLCPDPVFSLPAHFTVPAREAPPTDLANTILVSGGAFGPRWLDDFVRRVHDAGRQVASLPNPDKEFDFPQADRRIPRPIGPLAWYRSLATAGGFVGIRFHAFVSCLANGTPAIHADQSSRLELAHRLRSRGYDVCRRAGITGRYVDERALARMDPARVLERLFDPVTQARADAYGREAAGRFGATVDRIVELAAGGANARTEPEPTGP